MSLLVSDTPSFDYETHVAALIVDLGIVTHGGEAWMNSIRL